MADAPKAPQRLLVDDLPDEYYRLVCQHAGVALIATDTDLNIRVWNNAASRLFGASAGRMISASLLSILACT